MSGTTKKKKVVLPAMQRHVCGYFTKKEAMKLVGEGVRHIHSSMLGERDACAKVSKAILQGRKDRLYPWEKAPDTRVMEIRTSAERYDKITTLLEDLGAATRRSMAERIRLVLEELLTNSIFHAYCKKDGTSKYPRNEVANLEESEIIQVKYGKYNEGFYLSVVDQGGSLILERIAKVFERCSADNETQIEKKAGGAGLGLYMIFGAVMHLKIEVEVGRRTVVSCWVPHNRRFDNDVFSLNYFLREE